MNQAALYLRSSKDRHDVSLDAQRRELMELAKSRNLAIIEQFQDAVESGKDDQRPGFQAMLRALKDPMRTWNHLLALDTSRIARNQYLAHVVHYECEKRGIKVLYAKVPETNTVMDVVIRAVMQSFDQLHSLMSREKGLSGMAENVKQGWRAGGRAPYGYRLERTATGAVRDGEPVTKSKLVAGPEAAAVKRYLADRAAGVARRQAAKNAGLCISDSSLIGMEWNALTYAGHTVWNVHAERIAGGGYKGGAKRRPRADWVIQHDTHQALISTEDAEVILARLEDGRPKRYRTPSDYLLSGLLVTPEGHAWHGNGDGNYRVGKGKRVRQEDLEQAVVAQVARDLLSDSFVTELLREARKMSEPPPQTDAKPLREQITTLTVKADRLAALAAESEAPRPFLEQIRIAERQREVLQAELDVIEADQRSAAVLRAISEGEIRKLLAELADHLDHVDRSALKELIAGIMDRIELDPTSMECRIHYRIQAGEFVASPRGFEPRLPP